jgi:hypothetical protein
MLWWFVGATTVVVALYVLYNIRKYRGPEGFMRSAQERLRYANNLWLELERLAALGQLDYQKVLLTERQLHKLFLVQRGDTKQLPEHGQRYAAQIEYLYRKTKNIRATGGRNIGQIEVEYDVSFASAESAKRLAQQQRQDLTRRWGVD